MQTFRSPLSTRTLAAISALSVSALITACGGGGGGSASAPEPVAGTLAAVYFTDDFSAEHDAVWITISKVTAVTPAGEVELISYATPLSVNLPELRRSGLLAATSTIPADATAVRVYAGNTARLQKLDGTLMDVTLALPAGYLEFKLEGWKRNEGALALDFDLPRFTLSGSTLTPATRLATPTDMAGWNHRSSVAEGVVSAVSATSITITTEHLGARSFAIDSNTSVLGSTSGWAPAVGAKVKIWATVSGTGTDALVFTARTIRADDLGPTTGRGKIEGLVTAVNGNSVTVSVTDSESSLTVGSIILDLSSARFECGTLAAIVPGVRLEAFGATVGNNWKAAVVEIEGAAKTGTPVRSPYAEARGFISAVLGSLVSFKVSAAEHLQQVALGSTLTIDTTQTRFDAGAASCLAVGTPIEVKGYVDAQGAFQALKLELQGGCAAAYPGTGPRPDEDKSGNSTATGTVEAKGSIAAVRANEFDIQVFKSEGFKPAATLTVRFASTTLFRGLRADTLRVGQFVEVKGTLDGSVLLASKVELD